jgi:hypothetical protein
MGSHGIVAAKDMKDISTVLFSVFDGFEERVEMGIYSLEMGIVCNFSNCKLKNDDFSK